MARNSEKQYGKLNRLILFKEREEYEKTHPKRPKLDTLETADEIKQWLPSIKRDLDFYLKKSQVTCYSDSHIEDSRNMVCKLEKEFKAFVRKIKQITPGTLDAVPWTNRAYKKKNCVPLETSTDKSFAPIPTPILSIDSPPKKNLCPNISESCMNQPLVFTNCNNTLKKCENANVINCNSNEPLPRNECVLSPNHDQRVSTGEENVSLYVIEAESLRDNNKSHTFVENNKCALHKDIANEDSEPKGKDIVIFKTRTNILGINYDDSSENDDS